MKVRWRTGEENEVPDDIGRAAVKAGRAVEIKPPPDATKERRAYRNKERRAAQNKSISQETKS